MRVDASHGGHDATTPLLGLLGRNVLSPEAAQVLSRYPGLRRDPRGRDDGEAPVAYLRSVADGLLVKVTHDGEILAVFMMSEGKDGFSQFRGELPGGLSFASRPSDALKALGAPGHSRPAGTMGAYAHGELLRFDRPDYSIHFQFRSDRGGIELVTAMVASAVPGRSVAD